MGKLEATGGLSEPPHPRKSDFCKAITPTSYQYNHENLFFRDPEIIDFRGPDGSGAPEATGAAGAVQTPKIDDYWVPEN